ncbi:MAG: hypothetical protein FWH25_02170, partial [Syntrophorhabdaceae bacterium]|nr:hypothetical protein [Syntrophorhabdaceae bacterium]
MSDFLNTLSFEHVALALERRDPAPCVQWMRVASGARSFFAAKLFSRLSQTILYLCPDVKEAEEAARELTAYLGSEAVLPYPSVEVSPYEPSRPLLPAVHDRMRAFHRIISGPPAVLVASADAVAEKSLPPEVFLEALETITPGCRINIETFSARLVSLGYARLPAVSDPGDFAVRGGILDVYSPNHPLPARLLLDDDVVESVRWFHPQTQRTIPPGAFIEEEPDRLTILPCSQVIMRGEYITAAEKEREWAPWVGDLRQGIRFHGVESLLPRFYGGAASVFSFLPKESVVVAADSAACQFAVRSAFDKARKNWSSAGEKCGYPPPEELLLSEDELRGALSEAALLAFDDIEAPPFGRRDYLRGETEAEGNMDIRRSMADASSEGLLYPLATEASNWWKRGEKLIVTSLSPSHVDRMED